jgi:hypothetical protein
LQEALSPHDIDVWCLALSNAEPSKGADDLINGASAELGFGFKVTVLSPMRMGIRFLYACHPELFRRQYGEEPLSVSKTERSRRIEEFGKWLEETSMQRPRGARPGWQAVTAHRMGQVSDDPDLARTYLRGLAVTCPWEAVVHGWAVPRLATEARLLEALDGAEPGFTYEWLISAGGEGKSTVLSRLAWQAAVEREDVRVFWADEAEPATLPVDWLETLPAGTRAFFFVDGTAKFDGLERGIRSSSTLAANGVCAVALLADRGNRWAKHRSRLVTGRARKNPVKLEPLSEAEQSDLLTILESRELLGVESRAEAAALLTRAASEAGSQAQRDRWTKSWLLPTMMRLTDPEGRPFDRILASVLGDLLEGGQDDALRLMLAISLVHAAGPGLPRDLAERLVGSRSDLVQADELLAAELERQFKVPRQMLTRSSDVYRTHGSVVSDGFVHAAGDEEALRPWLLEVCRALPESMAPEYDHENALREDRFDLLDAAVNYLDREVKDHEGAVAVLTSWVELNPLAFNTVHRLGGAYSHWVQQAASNKQADPAELQRIVEEARNAFRQAISVAEYTLGLDPVPAPYAGYDLGDQRRMAYRAWALLEATVGSPHAVTLGGKDDLIRAVYLSLLGASKRQRGLVVTSGLLARVLDRLGEIELAAPLIAYVRAVEGPRSQTLGRVSAKLRASEVPVPDVAEVLLPPAMANIGLQVIDGNWGVLNLKASEAEHRQLLFEALTRFSRELPPAEMPEGLESIATVA